MKKLIDRRECDQCHTIKEQSEVMIGGTVFQGWLTVERTNGSSMVTFPRKSHGPWDFCGAECCIKFLKEN